MRNAGLDEAQDGIKIAGRNINNLRYAGLKFNIQKIKIMASSPISSWEKKMEKMWKQWQILFLRGSQIMADGDCSHGIKRRLLLGRKAMTNLDSILKSRDITLLTSLYSQRNGFSSSHVWM